MKLRSLLFAVALGAAVDYLDLAASIRDRVLEAAAQEMG